MTDSNEPNKTATRSEMPAGKLLTLARIVLGLIFTLSGLNHLLGLVPMPAMSGNTALFWQGLQQTGYFFPLLGVVELAAGLLMSWRRGVPLATIMIAPIVLNVAAFHAVLAPQALGMVAVIVTATVYVARRNRAAYARILTARAGATPGAVRVIEGVLGVAFVASGLAGFMGHTPPPSTIGAAAMMKGLAAAGYFLPALCGVQIVAGTMLVVRRTVGLALAVLFPVVVEIFAYRVYVAAATPGMMTVATVLLAAEAYLCFAHRDLFAPLVGGPGVAARRRAPRAAMSASVEQPRPA